jgi:hypothetical protein
MAYILSIIGVVSEKKIRFGIKLTRNSVSFVIVCIFYIAQILSIKWKTNNASPSEQFQNQIGKSQKLAKMIPLAHILPWFHSPGWV